MAIFRIEKTKNYTVMANHHLQNMDLSLKAKGLLSVMLSTPDNWEHSIVGYSKICRDGIDGITSAIKELEKFGYIIRKRIRNEKGHFTNTEYTIYEYPKILDTETREYTKQEIPKQEIPKQENLKQENPIQENPIQENPRQENPVQLSTKELSTKELNTDILNPYLINQKGLGFEKIGFNSFAELVETVHRNIEYEHFMKNSKYRERNRITEMTDLIIETLCSTRPYINIAGNDYPSELVKGKMLKLNSGHIQYVIECLNNNKVDIKNIKRYLLATLFNAPSTIDNYYSSLVNYDMYDININK